MSHPYDDDCTCDSCIRRWMATVREFNEAAERLYPSTELVPAEWRERALRGEAAERALRETVGELLDLVDLSNRYCTECGARLVCPHRNDPDWTI